MRAMLIVNPHATSTTERRRDLFAHALAGTGMTLQVEHTATRGHAVELGAKAREDGTALVVVHGGDGTVNEAVNGMLSAGVGPATPMLAVLPGGSTNVFARALGMAQDPIVATEQILEALEARRNRIVSVGRAGDRFFTFNAGLGLDAEVVKAVEDHRATGRGISNSLHVRQAVRQFFATNRSTPRLTVTAGGQTTPGLFLAILSNVDPWTYMANRPVRTNPGLAADGGLGLLALRSLRLMTTLRVARQLVGRRSGPRGRAVLRVDDTDLVTVTASEPVGLQLDGDYLGERTEVEFRSVPRALRVVV